jgi:hypothetical protein
MFTSFDGVGAHSLSFVEIGLTRPEWAGSLVRRREIDAPPSDPRKPHYFVEVRRSQAGQGFQAALSVKLSCSEKSFSYEKGGASI